jgi:hypothetical protein
MPDHDEMVELARRHGKTLFHRFEDVPGCAGLEQ